MADLRVNLFGKQLAGPVIAASGTFGFGPEYAGIEDLRVLGGISGKGLTLNGQPGNDGERLLETPSGLMNSIGLQNPGVQHFIENELPAMKTCGTSVWVNLGGHTIEENVEGVQKLCAAGIDVLELNISCPNVKQGGLAFGIRAKDAEEVVSAVRKVCTVPLVVKLSPQAESIPDMCKAVEAAGADGISLCNTFQACAIDLEKRRPVFNNTFAGLSGPAIRPIALRMVWQAVGAVNIPVIGLGGILTGRDALEFIMAGAAAVQVGTANFLDPKACTRITAEIGEWMDAQYYLRFWLSSCRTSLAVSALRIMRCCQRIKNNEKMVECAPRGGPPQGFFIIYSLFFGLACINIQDVAILCNLWYSKTAFINGGKYHGKRIDRSFEGM